MRRIHTVSDVAAMADKETRGWRATDRKRERHAMRIVNDSKPRDADAAELSVPIGSL
jgi:hypothetical protein